MADVSVSRDIAAPAEELWARVSDITRMGEWSPESTGGSWLKGATGPSVGARFVGTNSTGEKAWKTTCTVTECQPGRVFTFRVSVGPIRVAEWAYRFEQIEGGTRVTESWTDQRSALMKPLGKLASGVGDRATHNRATMEATLEALAASAG